MCYTTLHFRNFMFERIETGTQTFMKKRKI